MKHPHIKFLGLQDFVCKQERAEIDGDQTLLNDLPIEKVDEEDQEEKQSDDEINKERLLNLLTSEISN